jgi:hypothetical protein
MALAVRLIGAFFVSAGFTSGVVVVAMGISLKGLDYYYSKALPQRRLQSRFEAHFPAGSRLMGYASLLDDH